jgi:hypothetical protein
MLDLYKNKYDRDTLKKNIYSFNLLDILKTQHLDYSFVVRYILNINYQFTHEEQSITTKDVLCFQPHLNKDVLEKEYLLYIDDNDNGLCFDN